ncbi:MAG: ABC transporter ATP-binding protein [Clostridia bacterium]|nr:ABC transporter ATP-binding protein [Clostridia bacterium]
MMEILKVENVSKSFDNKKIINDVSFSVESGKIVGLLGKNGSGKTTILKMINDLLTIDSGTITIAGVKVSKESKALVSFLPERTYLNGNQTVKQVFDFFEDFYADFDRKRAEELLKDLDLNIDASLLKMSKGMKEKVQLVLVMSRRAKLYILDEPLGGVDPSTRDYIMKTILKNFSEDSAMIITTHLVSDVEKILDEVIFIDKGKTVLSGSADKLREEYNLSIDEIFRREIK